MVVPEVGADLLEQGERESGLLEASLPPPYWQQMEI